MSDNWFLYLSSLICSVLIGISIRVNRQFGVFNILFFCLYSSFLYYYLFCKNEGGSGFLWWLYLLVLTLVQLVVVGAYIGIKGFKRLRGLKKD